MEFFLKYKWWIIGAIIIIIVLILIYNNGKDTGTIDANNTNPSVTVLNPYDITQMLKVKNI